MKLIQQILIILTVCSCYGQSRHNSFIERPFKKVLLCDTIFDESFKGGKRTLKIYEQAEGAKVIYNGTEYFRYRVSMDEDGPWDLVRFEDDKIYLVSDAVRSHPARYREELLIDFSARPLFRWEATQGSLLTNSTMNLDSVGIDGLYYISAKSIMKIADAPEIRRLVFSKQYGIVEISLISLGDHVTCRCQDVINQEKP